MSAMRHDIRCSIALNAKSLESDAGKVILRFRWCEIERAQEVLAVLQSGLDAKWWAAKCSRPPIGRYRRTHCEMILCHVRCVICGTGWRNSLKIQWTQKLQRKGIHPQARLVNQIRNLQAKWYRVSTAFSLTSRKTEIAKNGRGPRLQGLLGENAPVLEYLEQKSCRFQSSQ